MQCKNLKTTISINKGFLQYGWGFQSQAQIQDVAEKRNWWTAVSRHCLTESRVTSTAPLLDTARWCSQLFQHTINQQLTPHNHQIYKRSNNQALCQSFADTKPQDSNCTLKLKQQGNKVELPEGSLKYESTLWDPYHVFPYGHFIDLLLNVLQSFVVKQLLCHNMKIWPHLAEITCNKHLTRGRASISNLLPCSGVGKVTAILPPGGHFPPFLFPPLCLAPLSEPSDLYWYWPFAEIKHADPRAMRAKIKPINQHFTNQRGEAHVKIKKYIYLHCIKSRSWGKECQSNLIRWAI